MIVSPAIHRFSPPPVPLCTGNLINMYDWGWVRISDLLEIVEGFVKTTPLQGLGTRFVDLALAFPLHGEVIPTHHVAEYDTITLNPGVTRNGWTYAEADYTKMFVPAKWALFVTRLVAQGFIRVTRIAAAFKYKYKAYRHDGSNEFVKL